MDTAPPLISDPKDTQKPDLIAAQYITFTVATIFICLRFLSRKLTRINWWWDDYVAGLCYLVEIIWAILIGLWFEKGLGKHIKDVEGYTLNEALFYNQLFLFVGELLYAFALFLGKISILCFYWRMFRVTNIKLPIQVLGVCSIIWITIRTFMAIFHCVPVNKFWDSSIEGRCDIEDSKFFFGTTLVHVILDMAILALPIVQVSKLKLPVLQKVGIMLMFMFGIFICVAGIVLVVSSTKLPPGSLDITYNLSPIVIWASVEVNLVNVSICLPTIRPAFMFLFTCRHPQSQLGSGSGSHSYGPNSYSRSQTKKSIRLDTINKADNDESSSTHQLAESERGGVDDGEFEAHALDRYGGHNTTITGRGVDEESIGYGRHDSSERTGGIVVKNETVVVVSQADSRRR